MFHFSFIKRYSFHWCKQFTTFSFQCVFWFLIYTKISIHGCKQFTKFWFLFFPHKVLSFNSYLCLIFLFFAFDQQPYCCVLSSWMKSTYLPINSLNYSNSLSNEQRCIFILILSSYNTVKRGLHDFLYEIMVCICMNPNTLVTKLTCSPH